jgi:hypothetical protein
MTRGRLATYWALVAILFAAQAAYTFAGLDRLWYEETAEGIRNPFWLDHRLVYDGISSNVGWYGLVLLAYRTFGFSAYMAKYVRLALHVPFLIATAALLKRWIGLDRAWIPLVAVALSPTLLYFNSLGTSFGTDVQLGVIVLWAVMVTIDRRRAGRDGLGVWHFAIGFAAMYACLVFPSFLVYLPVLALLYLSAAQGVHRRDVYTAFGWMAAGFAAPLCAALVFLKNDAAFLWDPAAGGAGMFRGGGNAFAMDVHAALDAMSRVARDLYVAGGTYYFTVPNVEFSGALGLVAVSGVLLGWCAAVMKSGPTRTPLVLAAMLAVLSFVAPAFAGGLPGLRRSTGMMVGFYVIAACMWIVPAAPDPVGRWAFRIARFAAVLLVVHHIDAYPANYRYLAGLNGAVNDRWFSEFGSPSASVRQWAHDWVLNQRPLDCHRYPTCRYSEIYPAVAGYLKWNGLGEPPVFAVDPGSSHILQLAPWYWESHTLEH